MSSQGPPYGQQPPHGDQPPQQGGPPPGYGGTPPDYGGPPYGDQQGGPPPGYGGPPPGYGAPPGYGGGAGSAGSGFEGPKKSKAPLIIGIVAGVLILLGVIGGAFLVLNSDGEADVAISESPQTGETSSETASEIATEDPTAEPPATTTPRPTRTRPSALPQPPSTPPPPPPTAPQAPPAPPPPPGGGMVVGDTFTGTVTEEQPIQEFTFMGAAGEQAVITAIGDAGLDPRLTLFGPDDAVVAENDDAAGLPSALDSRITTPLPVDGMYRIEVAAFSGTGTFQLSLDFPPTLTSTDAISADTPQIVYDYDGVAGQTIVIDVVPADDMVDPAVEVLDPNGASLDSDDDSGDETFASRLEVTFPTDGVYQIIVSAFAERYGTYDISISEI